MVDESNATANPKPNWPPTPPLVMCVVCLLFGFLAGYLLRGSASSSVHAVSAAPAGSVPSDQPANAAANRSQATQPPHKMPTLDDLKRMADSKAAPLLERLKSDPQNSQLENQIGLIYENAHQFKQAAGYFEKSLRQNPRNIGVRADYASCLYYTGDVDGALAQLNQSLTYDPKHAGTLLNIGIIRWKGKNDVDGAVASWEKLLRYHPDFPQKEALQQMITQAKQTKTAGPHEKG
ncbi:MAG: tetratricopeptide repeat protein [Candidatus Sulfotelmatobacter sp.]